MKGGVRRNIGEHYKKKKEIGKFQKPATVKKEEERAHSWDKGKGGVIASFPLWKKGI